LITSHAQVLECISRIIEKKVTPGNRILVTEIIASHLNVPWHKENIEIEMGSAAKIRRAILLNRNFGVWILKNFAYANLILFRMLFGIPGKQKKCDEAIFVYSLTATQVLSVDCNLTGFLSDPRIGLDAVHRKSIIVEIAEEGSQVSSAEPSVRCVRNIPEFYFREYMDPKTRIEVISRIYWSLVKSLTRLKILDIVFMRQAIIEYAVNSKIVEQVENLEIITTQSNIRRLPSIFYLDSPKTLKKMMIWYSNNSNAIEHGSDSRQFDATRNHRGNIDVHLVWGEHWEGELLKQNPTAVVKAVGSLMFYPRMLEKKQIRNAIIIFDVTPITNFKHYSFYSRQMILNFLEDILLSIEMVNSRLDQKNQLNVVIKQKRKYTKYSDSIFVNQFKSIINRKYISLSPPESNLYELISSARMVIGIPYVSPVFIAREFGIPSCYYISEEFSEWNLQSELDGTPTRVGKEAILKWIEDQAPLS